MDFKLKFSDIIKHLGLGIAMCALAVMIVPEISSAISSSIDADKILSILDSTGIVGQVLLLIFAYILGLLVQTAISILYGHGFNGMSIDEYCYSARLFGRLSDDDFPNWVFWSSRPGKVLRELTDQTELKLKSETRSEWLILNQLFEGIYCILLVGLITLTILSTQVPQLLKIAIYSVCIFQFVASRVQYFILHQAYSLSAAIINFALFIVAGSIMCSYQEDNKFLFMAIGMLLTFLCARFFAKRHLLSMDSLNVTDRTALNKLLRQTGLPTAFVLVRTNSARHLDKALESIAQQNYPSIKVILLEDAVPRKGEGNKSVENCVRDCEEKFSGLNILYYRSDRSGPSALTDEIHELFLKVSTDGDISIMLDSDDYFASEEVISDIVTKTYRSGAGICVSTFELFGRMSLNYAKDYHNLLVKRISRLKLPLKYNLHNRLMHKELVNDIYHISTIGWVKSYRRQVVEEYVSLKNRSRYSSFVMKHSLRIYEDFPDILALLSCKEGICAIHNPSHRFRKEEGSVTTAVGVDNYSTQIPGFLAVTCLMAEKAAELVQLPEGTPEFIRKRFTVFKFIQYLDVVLDKQLSNDACLKTDDSGYFCAKDFVVNYLQLQNEALRDSGRTDTGNSGDWLMEAYLNEIQVIEKEKIMDFKHKDLHTQVIREGIMRFNYFITEPLTQR